MKEKEYSVSGYNFTDYRAYKEAKHEAESIDYIRENTDLNDRNKVLKLYHRLIEKGSFHTIIGYGFLKELQENILREGIISKENLPCINIRTNNKTTQIFENSLNQDIEPKNKTQAQEYRILLRVSRIINIFLTVIIIIMFLITIFSDRSKFNNYENSILDKYSAWEEELENREKILDEREAAKN